MCVCVCLCLQLFTFNTKLTNTITRDEGVWIKFYVWTIYIMCVCVYNYLHL